MKRFFTVLLITIFLPAFGTASPPSAGKLGFNFPRPIGDHGELPPYPLYDAASSTGASWARVNFILGPWSKPSYEEWHSGNHFFSAYDVIINEHLRRGVRIYALVGYEAVGYSGDVFREYPGPNPSDAEAWIQRYKENFLAIARHFRGRIQVYELYNEPNDWAGGNKAAVHPCWNARMMEEIYIAAKTEFGGEVTIISGPILGLDVNFGAGYLWETYRCGIGNLSWSKVRAQTGSYPLDGIGYHPYLAQGPNDLPYLSYRLRKSLNAIWYVLSSFEGAKTPKKIWVSEVGWSSAEGEEFQAKALSTALPILLKDQRVAAAFWFTLSDYPWENSYGLYREVGWGKYEPKKSFFAFQSLTD